MPPYLLRFAALALGAVVALAAPAPGHNGRVALARPVSGIVVDGDLSDWPADSWPNPVRLTEYGQPPTDLGDLTAQFLVGYDPVAGSLYVAVDVRDQSVVGGPTGTDQWNTADGCEVVVSLRHHETNSEPLQHYVYGSTTSAPSGRGEGVTLAWKHGEASHQYEWRIPLVATGEAAAADLAGRSLGLDVVVVDADTDSSFSWVAWGRGVAKHLSEAQQGDVVLLPAGAATGRLSGATARAGGPEALTGRLVRVRPDTATEWVHLISGADGRFAAELPVGHYLVDLGAELSRPQPAHILERHDTQVSLGVPRAEGRRQPAGSGRRREAGRGIRQGIWHSLSTVDGLAGNTVYAVLQGRDGYLWLGTDAGLSRFDGRYLVNFDRRHGLVDDEVRSLTQDASGVLWIGTGGGISRYDGSTFTSFTAAEGLLSNQVRALAIDRRGHLWVGTDAGLAHYDGWDFTSYTRTDGLPGSQIRSLAVDALGDVWMGVWGRGVTRYDGAGFTTWSSGDGLLDNGVRPVLEDRSGHIWIGSEGGLSRFDGKKFETYTTADGLPDASVFSLFEDRSGDLWVGTENAGVSRFDGQRFVPYTGRDGLAGDWVLAFGEDREGVVWVGTVGGVSRVDERLTTYTTDDGLPQNTTSDIIEDRHGDLWLANGRGTTGGLTRFDGRTFRAFGRAEGLPHPEVWSVLEAADGRLWVGTTRGVAHFDGERFSSAGLSPGPVSGHVNSLAQDAAGDLWFATATSGLVRYRDGEVRRFTTADGLAHDRVLYVTPSRQGGIWAATEGGGVSHFDGATFTNQTRADGLASDTVWVVIEDEERLLFGTPNGLCEYTGQGCRTYTTEDGLAGNSVRDLLLDKDGHLWVGTDAGLSRFDGQVFQTLLRRDGLASNAVRSLLGRRDGTLWVGSMGGVTRYLPSTSPPPIVVTDVITEGRQGPLNRVEMRTTQDFVAFEFTGISYKTRPEAMAYRYRLQGHDPDWRLARVGRAEYENLPAGQYTFEVVAIDRDLSQSETPAAVAVVVRRAYGRILTGAALALAVLLIAWQTRAILRGHRNLRRAHDSLEVRVEERTAELRAAQDQLVMQEKMASLGSLVAGVAHEINNPVGAVNSATDVSSRCIALLTRQLAEAATLEELRENPRFGRALDLLEKNNRVSRTGTERIREIVDSLRSFARLDQADLQRADLHEGLDSTLMLLHHQLKNRIEVVKDYGRLPQMYCYPQELNQVFMNLLANAIQAIGDRPGHLRITTGVESGEVRISIGDDGSGIAPAAVKRIFDPGFTTKGVGVGTGLGLAISYRIIERHRGEILVDSELGRGTTFTLVLPRHLEHLEGQTT